MTTATKTIKFSTAAVIDTVCAVRNETEQRLLAKLYAYAAEYEQAVKLIEDRRNRMVDALAELSEGRTVTYSLSGLGSEIERLIKERDLAKKGFKDIAEVGGYEVID